MKYLCAGQKIEYSILNIYKQVLYVTLYQKIIFRRQANGSPTLHKRMNRGQTDRCNSHLNMNLSVENKSLIKSNEYLSCFVILRNKSCKGHI